MEKLGGPIAIDLEPSPFRCLRDLFVLQAKRLLDAITIHRRSRTHAFLTYAELHRQVEETVWNYPDAADGFRLRHRNLLHRSSRS